MECQREHCCDVAVDQLDEGMIAQYQRLLPREQPTRFNSASSVVVVEFLQLLPSVICEESASESANLKEADLTELLKLYKDDIPSPRSLDVEFVAD